MTPPTLLRFRDRGWHVVQACKSSSAFKARAALLQEALTARVPVLVNRGLSNPRKGVFCVKVGRQQIFSTGPEKQPFPMLKAMDVQEVAAKVKAALAAL